MTVPLDEPRGPRRTGTLAALLTLAALAFCVFAALGVWQVQRLGWKQDLIARVEQRTQAAPVEAPGPPAWPSLSRQDDEYRRVHLRGTYDHAREALVRASTALGAGHWVLTPLQTVQGHWVLVNRGFVPPDRREPPRRGTPAPQGVQDVVGLLRLPEPQGGVLQANDPTHDRWYSRDVAGIARARGLAGPVAPYFVDASAQAGTESTWPRPGLTVLHFSNNHLVYAITWFALAAMTAGAIGYLLLDEQRLRRLAGDPRPHDRR